VRASSSSPRACSGYATVPIAVPGLVINSSDSAMVATCDPSAAACWRCSATSLARPKSRILACRRVVTKMLAGLISRCTIPLEWAASKASAI